MKKNLFAVFLAVGMSMALSSTAFASGWRRDEEGQWKEVKMDEFPSSEGVHHNEGFDSAHPLAGKTEEWGLSLPYPYVTIKYVGNENVQALLTNQMDAYFLPPAGDSMDRWGNHLHISEEVHEENVRYTEAVYQWFCKWLNSFDFENMTEMERAEEIQKVLAKPGYDIMGEGGEGKGEYSVLINGYGNGEDFALTAVSLAKALGLKAQTSAYGMKDGPYTAYYIQVDGKAYCGTHQSFGLQYPVQDPPYFTD